MHLSRKMQDTAVQCVTKMVGCQQRIGKPSEQNAGLDLLPEQNIWELNAKGWIPVYFILLLLSPHRNALRILP